MADPPSVGDALEEIEERLRGHVDVDAVEMSADAAIAAHEQGDEWTALGNELHHAREATGLSKREAALVAGFSEGTWRQLEAGNRRLYGQDVKPNPSDDVLYAAAVAVRFSPELAFDIVSRRVPDRLREIDPGDLLMTDGRSVLQKIRDRRPTLGESRHHLVPAALAGKLARLNDDQRARLEEYLDEMLDG